MAEDFDKLLQLGLQPLVRPGSGEGADGQMPAIKL